MLKSDHFAFRVSDIDASIAFYTEKVGLRLMFKQVDVEHGEAFAFLELDGGNLELLQLLDASGDPVPVANPLPVPPFTPHLALGTDDLDGMIARLKAGGVPLVKGPLETPGLVRWVYFRDPDNNVVEFVQWLNQG